MHSQYEYNKSEQKKRISIVYHMNNANKVAHVKA